MTDVTHTYLDRYEMLELIVADKYDSEHAPKVLSDARRATQFGIHMDKGVAFLEETLHVEYPDYMTYTPKEQNG